MEDGGGGPGRSVKVKQGNKRSTTAERAKKGMPPKGLSQKKGRWGGGGMRQLSGGEGKKGVGGAWKEEPLERQ